MKEQHGITWRGIALTITFTPDWLSVPDHLEIETEAQVPLPVTVTGYRSRCMRPGSIEVYGGAVAFTTGWLDADLPVEAAGAASWESNLRRQVPASNLRP